MNYVCNVEVDGKRCGVTIPADEVGAALMQAHLEEAHREPSRLPYVPRQDRHWGQRTTRIEELADGAGNGGKE